MGEGGAGSGSEEMGVTHPGYRDTKKGQRTGAGHPMTKMRKSCRGAVGQVGYGRRAQDFWRIAIAAAIAGAVPIALSWMRVARSMAPEVNPLAIAAAGLVFWLLMAATSVGLLGRPLLPETARSKALRVGAGAGLGVCVWYAVTALAFLRGLS